MAKRAKNITVEREEQGPPIEAVAPIGLGEVIGQEKAVRVLRDSLKADRIHHAWIFHGPAGVGKFTTAVSFASLLLDPTTAVTLAGEFEAEPESKVQTLLRAGSHPDFHVIRKELAVHSRDSKVRDAKQTNIPVKVLNEFLLEPAARTAQLAGVGGNAAATKVFIVDEAELLAAEGQNRLLKTLEEPPSGTVLILVTSREEGLLPTIRSRCQRVAFTSLTDEEMASWVSRQGLELEKEELEWLLIVAGGSPGGFSLAWETGMGSWREPILRLLRSVQKGVFPPDAGVMLGDLVKAWAEAWVSAHPGASKDAANRAGTRHIIRILTESSRVRLRRSLEGGSPLAHLDAIDAAREAEVHLARNVRHDYVLGNLAARIATASGV